MRAPLARSADIWKGSGIVDLTIATSSFGGWQVLTVAGDLDLASASSLRERVQATGSSAIILDVGGVTFIDSSGLGALVSSMTDVEGRGGAVRLVSPDGTAVDRLIHLTGLAQLIGTSSSLDDLGPTP